MTSDQDDRQLAITSDAVSQQIHARHAGKADIGQQDPTIFRFQKGQRILGRTECLDFEPIELHGLDTSQADFRVVLDIETAHVQSVVSWSGRTSGR